MPRRIQVGTAGLVFHVLNRGVRRLRLFDSSGDYRAFLCCVAEAKARIPIRLLFLTVCRYVERNPQRAGLVKRAEDWPWSSLAQRGKFSNIVPLDTWPILQPPDWVNVVNGEEPTGDVDRIRKSLRRGLPMGERSWMLDTANRLGLESAIHPRGRPRK